MALSKAKANTEKAKSKKKGNNKIAKYTFKSIWSIIKIVIVTFVIIGIAGSAILFGMVKGWLDTTEEITFDQLELKSGLTSFIYDNEGNVIAELTGKDNINRIPVTYAEIPVKLEEAIISIEDERYYSHFGIDLTRIMGSIVSLVVNKGIVKQGGSTITQQVVKHITSKWEQSFERKVQEWYNAIQLEKVYDKKRILTMYCNLIYFGNGCYGVQSAATYYFGVDVSDLSIAQCAVLAGIPNLPGQNDPSNTVNKVEEDGEIIPSGREYTKARQLLVLSKMYELGYINDTEYEEAKNEPLNYIFSEENRPNKITSYFVDEVINTVITDLAEENGISSNLAAELLYSNGYKVYTTMDSDIQDTMNDVFNDPAFFPEILSSGVPINTEAQKYGESPQAGMVIIDPSTGEIVALYGGNGEKEGSRTFNRATQLQRQPGSSFKPIAVYGPGIDMQTITAATIIDDVPSYLDEKNPEVIYPTNYISGRYQGLTTIRNGLKASVNVVAAKVWKYYIGRDNCIDYLKRVGIDRDNEIYDDSTVSIAMGGLASGVSPLEMASAYGVFANKGIYCEPTIYTKVLDSEDNIILQHTTDYKLAYSEEAAFIMTDLLQEVVGPPVAPYNISGTAYWSIRLNDGKMPVAGKTGTTSDYLDKWFVGFTPYYTAAVWYGYDNTIKPIKLKSPEYSGATMIWDAVMERVHADLPIIEFDSKPSGVIEVDICQYSGMVPTKLCTEDPRGNAVITEYFIEGTEPAYFEQCNVHALVNVCTNTVDEFGRYLPATSECPKEFIERVLRIVRPEAYIPKDEETPDVVDMKYEVGFIPEEEVEEEEELDKLDEFGDEVIDPEDTTTVDPPIDIANPEDIPTEDSPIDVTEENTENSE